MRARARWENAASSASRFRWQYPRPRLPGLARPDHELPWERVFVTFSDERCVRPTTRKATIGWRENRF
jgi:hypothetical protein